MVDNVLRSQDSGFRGCNLGQDISRLSRDLGGMLLELTTSSAFFCPSDIRSNKLMSFTFDRGPDVVEEPPILNVCGQYGYTRALTRYHVGTRKELREPRQRMDTV